MLFLQNIQFLTQNIDVSYQIKIVLKISILLTIPKFIKSWYNQNQTQVTTRMHQILGLKQTFSQQLLQ